MWRWLRQLQHLAWELGTSDGQSRELDESWQVVLCGQRAAGGSGEATISGVSGQESVRNRQQGTEGPTNDENGPQRCGSAESTPVSKAALRLPFADWKCSPGAPTRSRRLHPPHCLQRNMAKVDLTAGCGNSRSPPESRRRRTGRVCGGSTNNGPVPGSYIQSRSSLVNIHFPGRFLALLLKSTSPSPASRLQTAGTAVCPSHPLRSLCGQLIRETRLLLAGLLMHNQDAQVPTPNTTVIPTISAEAVTPEVVVHQPPGNFAWVSSRVQVAAQSLCQSEVSSEARILLRALTDVRSCNIVAAR